MKRIFTSMGTIVASFALVVTTMSVNAACLVVMHQPKLPEGAKKLRKF